MALARGSFNLLARGLAARLNPAGGSAVLRSYASGTEADDMHDDFKPQFKEQRSGAVDDIIRHDISTNKVLLYMKGDPEAPMCGFSNMACQILSAYDVDFQSRNVLADPELREAIKKFSNWPTIPQLYIKGEFVGGSDILMGLHRSGDLRTLLSDGPKEHSSA
jgi:monothiol glutaredoxin